MMNRRSFFHLLAAATLFTAANVTALACTRIAPTSPIPFLHGDGVHDDTEAFQALLDGRSVRRPDGSILQGAANLPPGDYYLKGRLYIPMNTS